MSLEKEAQGLGEDVRGRTAVVWVWGLERLLMSSDSSLGMP